MASIAHGDPCVNECVDSRPVLTKSAEISPLVAANARLLARRAQLSARSSTETRETNSAATLPSHLNWGSVNLPLRPKQTPSVQPKPIVLDILASPALEQNVEPLERDDDQIHQNANTQIAVQPALLAGMLREGIEAIGRIYLLCRHLDTEGRGWLSIADLREQFTDKASHLHVCGWRRLRQILQAGKGLFWERDDHDRLWLYGRTRVAALLDVQYFSGDRVAISLRELCGKMGSVRGMFYAAFHAGRDSSPIARATLRTLTGVPERTQRVYDEVHDVERTTNYTLSADTNAHDTYYRHRRAAFPFIDKMGKRGKVGQTYIAIRLPNSYQTTRFTRLPTTQKRFNKRLRQDLVKYGTRGNSSSSGKRVYFTDGQQAARCFSRSENPIFLRERGEDAAVFWIGWGWK